MRGTLRNEVKDLPTSISFQIPISFLSHIKHGITKSRQNSEVEQNKRNMTRPFFLRLPSLPKSHQITFFIKDPLWK